MRYIELLPDLELTLIDGSPFTDAKGAQVKVTHKEFLLARLSDPQFAGTFDDIMSLMKLKNSIERAETVISVEDIDFTRLEKSVRAPTGGYNPAIAHCLWGFLKAVINAKGDI